MKFIATGRAGFIRSHVTEQLLSEGHSVTVVDNLATGRLQNLPDHPHSQADISPAFSVLDFTPQLRIQPSIRLFIEPTIFNKKI
jgi:UDP-glucose 4-epimerase